MERQAAGDASELRRELGERSRTWAQGRAHVESYGQPGVIVFAPEDGRHGNFLEESYVAIAAQPEWFRRFDKIHSHGRALPRPTLCGSDGQPRKWRELDSSMSSDALLMNIFCAPGVAQSAGVRGGLAVDVGWGGQDLPIFGWKARVPLANGRVDRTEVDMRWGGGQRSRLPRSSRRSGRSRLLTTASRRGSRPASLRRPAKQSPPSPVTGDIS